MKEYARGFRSYGCARDSGRSLISDKPHTINLNRRVGVIPLGWDLSEQAEARIQEQARKLYLSFSQPGVYTDMLAGLSTRRKSIPTLPGSTEAYAGKFRQKQRAHP